jgi:hypothetical protein
MALLQRIESLTQFGGGASGDFAGTSQFAEEFNVVRDLRHADTVGDVHPQTQASQALQVAAVIAALPANDQIGSQGEDAFDVEAGEIADAWQKARGFRPVAEIDRGHQPISSTGGVEQFGHMRGKTDDALYRRLVTVGMQRTRQQQTDQQQTAGAPPSAGENDETPQLSQPTTVSAANTVTQMIAMR